MIAAQSKPIIVKLIDAPHDPTGLADVLLGAIGLTGVIVLGAVVLGLIVGALMFWLRSKHSA